MSENLPWGTRETRILDKLDNWEACNAGFAGETVWQLHQAMLDSLGDGVLSVEQGKQFLDFFQHEMRNLLYLGHIAACSGETNQRLAEASGVTQDDIASLASLRFLQRAQQLRIFTKWYTMAGLVSSCDAQKFKLLTRISERFSSNHQSKLLFAFFEYLKMVENIAIDADLVDSIGRLSDNRLITIAKQARTMGQYASIKQISVDTKISDKEGLLRLCVFLGRLAMPNLERMLFEIRDFRKLSEPYLICAEMVSRLPIGHVEILASDLKFRDLFDREIWANLWAYVSLAKGYLPNLQRLVLSLPSFSAEEKMSLGESLNRAEIRNVEVLIV